MSDVFSKKELINEFKHRNDIPQFDLHGCPKHLVESTKL